MSDQFGRTVRYLRVSGTDKCNLRCVYCMPLEGLDWLKREEILTYEEITEVVRTMAEMGLERVRITGGEPLIRRDLSDLVKMIADVPEIADLSLSTNAVLLADQAEALKQAGVQRLNISLDSLQADFSKVGDSTRDVLVIVESTLATEGQQRHEAVELAMEVISGHCGGTAEVVAMPD